MLVVRWFGLLLTIWSLQGGATPAYVTSGDGVEQQFHAYRSRLAEFRTSLRVLVAEGAPDLLEALADAPPRAVVYGYQILPSIVNATPGGSSVSVSSFTYSWPTTEVYVDGESEKLARAAAGLERVRTALAGRRRLLVALVDEYRTLVHDQRTVEQYIQYNRFWQQAIAEDRPRFDQLTALYNSMVSGDPDSVRAIRDVLANPDVPPFVEAELSVDLVVLHVPLYTDIEDTDFLERAEEAIEQMWQAADSARTYRVEVELRQVVASELYGQDAAPGYGDHIDIKAHAARFPPDGAVLTTGAETTHAFVGGHVALGPGEVSARTIAHEFGHLLGFRDGYIRGYRDLGTDGFEIMELTSVFDDIMSAPREGDVQVAHFELILEALGVR